MKKFVLLTLLALLACGGLFGAYIIRVQTNVAGVYTIYKNGIAVGATTPQGTTDIVRATKAELIGTWTIGLPLPSDQWTPTHYTIAAGTYFAPEGSDYLYTMSFNIDESNFPVELSSFSTALTTDNFVNVSWTTQTETGALGYYILRDSSGDISTAETISALIPATNTSQATTYNFKDTELYEEGTYYYWLQSSDLDGHVYYYGPSSILFSDPGSGVPQPPQVTSLGPVYPNPFNPNTMIPIKLKDSSTIELRIYNNRGQEVKHFDLGNLPAGYHQVGWDGCDDSGQTLPSGIYHIKMQAGVNSYQVKSVLMK